MAIDGYAKIFVPRQRGRGGSTIVCRPKHEGCITFFTPAIRSFAETAPDMVCCEVKIVLDGGKSDGASGNSLDRSHPVVFN